MGKPGVGLDLRQLSYLFAPFLLTMLAMLYRPAVNMLVPQLAPFSAVEANLTSACIFYYFAQGYCARFHAPREEILYAAACSLLYAVLVAVGFGSVNWHGVLFWLWLWPIPALCGTYLAYLKN